jgi:hypothetical protein
MVDTGCKKKFNVDEYIKTCQNLEKEEKEEESEVIPKKFKQRKITESMSVVTKSNNKTKK